MKMSLTRHYVFPEFANLPISINFLPCSIAHFRSDHLFVFFMQWSPDMYGEGIRGMGQEPAFMVVKKNEASESAEDEPITDLNVKEWEVKSTQLKRLCSHGSKCCVVPNPIDMD